MSISERINVLCELEGSQRKFSEKTGIAQPTISRMVLRQANVRSDNIIAIVEAYPNLNVEWFITGEGEMWKSDKPEKREEPLTEAEKESLKDEIIALQKARIKQLEQEIKVRNPEIAKRLGIE